MVRGMPARRFCTVRGELASLAYYCPRRRPQQQATVGPCVQKLDAIALGLPPERRVPDDRAALQIVDERAVAADRQPGQSSDAARRRRKRGGRAVTSTRTSPACRRRTSAAPVRGEMVPSSRSSVPSRSVATRRMPVGRAGPPCASSPIPCPRSTMRRIRPVPQHGSAQYTWRPVPGGGHASRAATHRPLGAPTHTPRWQGSLAYSARPKHTERSSGRRHARVPAAALGYAPWSAHSRGGTTRDVSDMKSCPSTGLVNSAARQSM